MRWKVSLSTYVTTNDRFYRYSSMPQRMNVLVKFNRMLMLSVSTQLTQYDLLEPSISINWRLDTFSIHSAVIIHLTYNV